MNVKFLIKRLQELFKQVGPCDVMYRFAENSTERNPEIAYIGSSVRIVIWINPNEYGK